MRVQAVHVEQALALGGCIVEPQVRGRCSGRGGHAGEQGQRRAQHSSMPVQQHAGALPPPSHTHPHDHERTAGARLRLQPPHRLHLPAHACVQRSPARAQQRARPARGGAARSRRLGLCGTQAHGARQHLGACSKCLQWPSAHALGTAGRARQRGRARAAKPGAPTNQPHAPGSTPRARATRPPAAAAAVLCSAAPGGAGALRHARARPTRPARGAAPRAARRAGACVWPPVLVLVPSFCLTNDYASGIDVNAGAHACGAPRGGERVPQGGLGWAAACPPTRSTTRPHDDAPPPCSPGSTPCAPAPPHLPIHPRALRASATAPRHTPSAAASRRTPHTFCTRASRRVRAARMRHQPSARATCCASLRPAYAAAADLYSRDSLRPASPCARVQGRYYGLYV